ncbi:MAG TPA: hypothetical protein VF715_09120 [Thermoleophilaceae bacterium]|jgi:hypothetical protein
MGGKRLRLLVLTAATALLIGAAPAGARPSCGKARAGGQVLAKTREAVVWGRGPDVFGCHRSVGRARRMPILWDGLNGFQLQGRYVAYAELREEQMDEFYDVLHVYDLVAGRSKVRVLRSPISSLVLKRNGSVGYIETNTNDPDTEDDPVSEVHAISNEDGLRDVTLDTGPRIDPKSLSLSPDRRTMSWTHGGETRSAPLR